MENWFLRNKINSVKYNNDTKIVPCNILKYCSSCFGECLCGKQTVYNALEWSERERTEDPDLWNELYACD